MNDEQALAQAHKAKAELELTDAAFTTLRTAMLDKLVATAIDQPVVREKLYLAVQTLDAVRQTLFETVQNGIVAEHALQALEG